MTTPLLPFGRRAPDGSRYVDALLAALAHGPQSGEALVAACRRAGLVPEDDRAFGAVFRRLSQQGRIVTVGYTTRTKGHGTAGGRVWAKR